MTDRLLRNELTAREWSLGHMKRFAEMLRDNLDLIGVGDKMRVSAVNAGYINVTNNGRTQQDSWEINLLLGARPKEGVLVELEKTGYYNSEDIIASIRYSFGGGYSITQKQQGLPGGYGFTTRWITMHADALVYVMRIIANIDFEYGISTLLCDPETKPFKRRWNDFLVLRRTLRAKRRIGCNEDSMAVVNYGYEKILVPYTYGAKRAMRNYFTSEAVRMFGGYVLSRHEWRDQVSEVYETCNSGTVLYLNSIYG